MHKMLWESALCSIRSTLQVVQTTQYGKQTSSFRLHTKTQILPKNKLNNINFGLKAQCVVTSMYCQQNLTAQKAEW